MADQELPLEERTEPQPQSRPEKIHIHDVRELRYWTRTLGISSDELVSAVRAVGNDPEKVRDFVRRKAS
jgi:hypothetical protein